MLKFETNLIKYESEMRDIIRMFIPFFSAELSIGAYFEDGVITVKIENKTYVHNQDCGLKVFCKIALYKSLSAYFRVKLPWGSLTGIRPTKMLHKIMSDAGVLLKDARIILEKKYLVSRKNAKLAADIICIQNKALATHSKTLTTHNTDSDYINLYVHIPFCPTKCGYCSFVTVPLERNKNLVKPYIDCLIKEIGQAAEIIRRHNKKILSVYVGGGTPTALSAEQLDSILHAIGAAAELADKNIEFTVEAGRPDTVTHKKLQVLKQNKVTRICVNPQSFCDSTLSGIGRGHSSRDTLAALDAAREFGFDINMDLIAGLKNESLSDFKKSLKTTAALRPDNITVHTLAIKNGSELSLGGKEFNGSAVAMVDFAQKELAKNGYHPYYLYRQKNMSGSLHNIGYCLNGKECVNNITAMEETVSVLACGAGAISKVVSGSQIERLANLRDVRLYIDEFDKRLKEKINFFCGC